MKNKIISMLNSTQKKVGAAALCGVLIASISAGTVFASNARKSLMVKDLNGVKSYSTDDGKTWSQNAPEGVAIEDKDGKITITQGTPPKDGELKGILSKIENGVRYYSIDGGKTWSEKAPEGFKELPAEMGNFQMLDENVSKEGIMKSIHIKEKNGDEKSLLIKEENGVKRYSTDEGKTWSEKAPEGFKEPVDGIINFKEM